MKFGILLIDLMLETTNTRYTSGLKSIDDLKYGYRELRTKISMFGEGRIEKVTSSGGR